LTSPNPAYRHYLYGKKRPENLLYPKEWTLHFAMTTSQTGTPSVNVKLSAEVVPWVSRPASTLTFGVEVYPP